MHMDIILQYIVISIVLLAVNWQLIFMLIILDITQIFGVKLHLFLPCPMWRRWYDYIIYSRIYFQLIWLLSYTNIIVFFFVWFDEMIICCLEAMKQILLRIWNWKWNHNHVWIIKVKYVRLNCSNFAVNIRASRVRTQQGVI